MNISRAFEFPYMVRETLCTTADEVTKTLVSVDNTRAEFCTENEKERLINAGLGRCLGAPKSIALAPVPVTNVAPTFSATLQKFASSTSAAKIYFDKSQVLNIKEVDIRSWSGAMTPNALASSVLQYAKDACYYMLRFKGRFVFVLWCTVLTDGSSLSTTKEDVDRMLICVKKASVVQLVQDLLNETVIQAEAHHPLDISDALVSELVSNEKRQVRPVAAFCAARPLAQCHTDDKIRVPPWCGDFQGGDRWSVIRTKLVVPKALRFQSD